MSAHALVVTQLTTDYSPKVRETSVPKALPSTWNGEKHVLPRFSALSIHHPALATHPGDDRANPSSHGQLHEFPLKSINSRCPNPSNRKRNTPDNGTLCEWFPSGCILFISVITMPWHVGKHRLKGCSAVLLREKWTLNIIHGYIQ